MKILRIGMGLALLIGLFALIRLLPLQAFLSDLLTRIGALGALGIVLYFVLYILACLLFIPGLILTLGAGVLFGVLKGAVIVSAASILGASAAFLAGRYLARKWVATKIEGNARFGALDRGVAENGFKIVALTRLSPVFPFNLLNYAFGLTRVSFKDYVLASWAGMLPGTLMYVYIGSLAGNLAGIDAAGRQRGPWEWALYGVGLLATLAVTVMVTRIAKKALSEQIL